jgi:uridine kinase
MQITDALFDLCKSTHQPIIAIDGSAGAGKTTLASHLGAALSLKYRVAIIHMDDLYNGWDQAFDHHLSDALILAATSHQKKTPAALPRFDWQIGSYGESVQLPSADLLILEGVGSSQRAVRPFLTTSIWLEIEPALGFERVIARDGQEFSEQMQKWLRAQEQHFRVEESKVNADFILTT